VVTSNIIKTQDYNTHYDFNSLMNPKGQAELLPIFSLLLVATMWGIFWYPLRLLNDAGLGGVWTTLLAYGAALLLGLPMLWRYRLECRQHFIYLLGIGLASGWCNMAFLMATLDGTIVRVLLLFYLSPLWAVLLGHFILGERMSNYGRVVMLVAMSGALMMLWVPELGFPWPQSSADWLAISAGFAFALANVLVRMKQEISITNKAISAWWGAIIIGLVWLLFDGVVLPEVGYEIYAGAIALGLFGFALATVAVQYGVTHMPVHRSAVILLFELVIGTAAAQLLTDEVVRPVEWFGGSLILMAAWLTTRRQLGHPD